MDRYDDYKDKLLWLLVILGCTAFFACHSEADRNGSTDIANNNTISDDDYYDDMADSYGENTPSIYEEVNNNYKINYLGDSIDENKYRDVEYEPYTHTVFVKTEGRVSFDEIITVTAPEGYEVDYCIPAENSTGKFSNIYGYINLKFTNTEKVVVREYFDTETEEYVNASFGTPIKKEKVMIK